MTRLSLAARCPRCPGPGDSLTTNGSPTVPPPAVHSPWAPHDTEVQLGAPGVAGWQSRHRLRGRLPRALGLVRGEWDMVVALVVDGPVGRGVVVAHEGAVAGRRWRARDTGDEAVGPGGLSGFAHRGRGGPGASRLGRVEGWPRWPTVLMYAPVAVQSPASAQETLASCASVRCPVRRCRRSTAGVPHVPAVSVSTTGTSMAVLPEPDTSYPTTTQSPRRGTGDRLDATGPARSGAWSSRGPSRKAREGLDRSPGTAGSPP